MEEAKRGPQETRYSARDSNRFVGSAVVTGASYGERTTTLKLQTFRGECLGITVDGTPEPAEAAELQQRNLRPISVKIQGGGRRCVAIALTPDGPRCPNVSLGAALALQQSGVRTVVDGGLRAEVACSAS